MADPTKKPDRLRPFKRINNDGAIPANAPDGLGVACGCHVPDDLPNLDDQFREFLKNRPGALGKIAQAIEVAKKVAETAKEVTEIVRTLQVLAAAVPAGLLGPLGFSGTLAHKRGDRELPDFPHSTVVLRPQLLRDLKKPAGNVKKIEPVIELLPSDKGPGIVEQVKLSSTTSCRNRRSTCARWSPMSA